MDMDGSSPEAANQAPAATPEGIARNVSYLDAGPLTDVMFDQLEYLIGHATESCRVGCVDCARLEQVKNWLLLPFR
jgi:hypothetical protein